MPLLLLRVVLVHMLALALVRLLLVLRHCGWGRFRGWWCCC